uniref:Uncharacterized protein n=1 Tax=Denticeps clupeoides TaxID=299321 RepID=A0AAY4AML0_9TELE
MRERLHLFQGQSYSKLKRSCLRQGILFKDPFFPPTTQSLFYNRPPPPGITWRRPRELCKNPRLFVDGISTRDLHQGSLGNCWMVAATSCLAAEPSLWKKVIPDPTEQEWNPKRPDLYAGIFHFRFWRLGRWTDVVVDDRLPVSEDGALLFCRSATAQEFWSALLEKAYAKLNGCYEALEGGNTAEALVDFTGGVSEPLSLDRTSLSRNPEQRKVLFQTLAKAHSHRALITCFIRSVLECGLVRGHAYGVTAVRRVRGEHQQGGGAQPRLCVVRLRNPWGTADWTGAWSQGSQQWKNLSRVEREKMGLTVRDVGEFWMDFEDFCCYFTDMVLCRLVETALLWPKECWREVRSSDRSWEEQIDKRSRCGGCINHRDTFLLNPQFMFEVQGEEELLICLQQEDRRMKRREGEGENLPIGFEVLRVEVNRVSRVQCVGEQAASSIYMDSRSVALRVTLGPGRYALLPTTFHPGATGHFLIRLFSHRELKEELPVPSVWQCCRAQPCMVTTVHLRRASGLGQPKQKAPDVYAIIRCDGGTVKTQVFKKNSSPEFNTKAIFYRRYPEVPIHIELWSHGWVWDTFLGRARLHTRDGEKEQSRVMELRGGQLCTSRVFIYVETSSSLCLADL